jgi:chromate transporter
VVTADDASPGAWQLFRLWAGIGFQSFGGGASTQFLIQEQFTARHAWLTPEELLHYLSLCTLTPGINLIALTILIGRKLAGVPGIIASLAGLLLPSAGITCLLAALVTRFEDQPAVPAALRGVVPATAGAMFLVGVNYMRPLTRTARRDGPVALLASALIIAASALSIIVVHIPVVVVVLAAIVLGVVLFPARPLAEEERREGVGKP